MLSLQPDSDPPGASVVDVAQKTALGTTPLLLTFDRSTGTLQLRLEKRGFKVDRRKIHLNEPLKNIGEYTVPIRLHREVTAHLKVTVKGDEPEVAKEVAE